MHITAQADIAPMMQEASSTMQSEGWKGAVNEQTVTCIAIQTQAKFKSNLAAQQNVSKMPGIHF